MPVNSRQRRPRQRKSKNSFPDLLRTPIPAVPYQWQVLVLLRSLLLNPGAHCGPGEDHTAAAFEVVLAFLEFTAVHEISDCLLGVRDPRRELTH